MIEPNFYFFVILIAVVVFYKLDLFCELLNLRALKHPMPKEFAGEYSEEEFARSQEYTRVQTQFGVIESTVSLVVFLIFWFFGGFELVDGWVRAWVESEILRGLIYISLMILATTLLQLPFEIYSTFVIEERFGFNKTTPGLFAIDRLTSLGLAAIIGLPVLTMILWFFGKFELAWLYSFLAVAAFSLVMTYLAPRYILPLFNRFQPLEDGVLKKEINQMAKKCEFPLTEISIMDGSKRSTKANAFFTGFGKNRKIALFDTLVETHSVKELVAVLAHEIGHFKKRHIVQRMVANLLNVGLTFYLLSLFLNNQGLFAAFGVQETSVYLSLVLFGFLYKPISRVLGLLMTLLSRKNEFEADAYAARVTGTAEDLISALKKLSRESLSNLNPHPFYVFLNYSHPPVLQRIQALRSSNF